MELQWPLILFTTFIAWSAGLFATQALYAWRGEGMKSQFAAWVFSAALLVAGGVSVFFHLQHWERIFNGFGHITSGITQELVAIVVLAVVAVVYLVFLRRLDAGAAADVGEQEAVAVPEGARMPAWLCWLAVAVSVILVVVMGHSYMMPSRPAWNSALQVASLLGAACALGPLTMRAICAARGEGAPHGGTLAVAGTAIGAVCTVLYAAYLQMSTGMFAGVADYYFDTPHPNAGMADLAAAVGGQAPVLWAGAVVVGALVPLALAFVARKSGGMRATALGSVGAACAFAGALCLRVAFYNLGLSSFLMF